MIPGEAFCSSAVENRLASMDMAVEELLMTAQTQDCLTVGIYESAQLLSEDPDSVVMCVLVTDDEDEDDVALQIHFTLLQSFCCDMGITILRVSRGQRLQQLLWSVDFNRNEEEHSDFNCMLVTNQQGDHCRLQEVLSYCQQRRRENQWVPELVLQEP